MRFPVPIAVAPFGFFGAGNIGDEAMLQGFARLASRSFPKASLWVAARNVEQCRRAEPSLRYFPDEAGGGPRARFLSRLARAHLIVGDTPITDVLYPWPLEELRAILGRTVGKALAFVAVGVERLSRPESVAMVRELIAPRVAAWSTRSARDRERLLEYGVADERITVAADLAWLSKPADPEFGRERLRALGADLSRPLIGVNVTNEGFVMEREPRLFETLAEFADFMIAERGASVVLFSNEVREDAWADAAACRAIVAAMREKAHALVVPNLYYTPQEMRSMIGLCRATVGSRYHFCIFSALEGVPFVAVKRQDKLADLCEDLVWEFGLELGAVTPAGLEAAALAIEGDRPSLSAHLLARAGALAGRAMLNEVPLRGVLR